ncbi:MAG: hypothetical protein Kow002_03470 [Anaerolineales bacterium]
MKANILVVTPVASFGEQIRRNLSQTGSYRVQVVTGTGKVANYTGDEQFSLALLDMELGEAAVTEAGRLLRTANPDIDLVILAQEDLPPAMDNIRPWVLLRKPFYLPDFIQLLQSARIVPDDARKPASEEETGIDEADIPWLSDVSKAAQHLTRLTLESSAQAALITREGKLWAYAGQLSQNAANELASTVSRHWDGQKGNDLLRFVRLESTKAEHMLYATRLTEEVILALVFDAETPFSTIRAQASNLAHSLALPGTGPVPAVESKPIPAEQQLRAEFEASEEESIVEDDEEDVELPSIAEILNDVPAPNPTQEEISTPIAQLDPSAAVTRPSTPLPRRKNRFSQESSPAVRLEELAIDETQQAQPRIIEELDATMPSPSQQRPSTPVRRPEPGSIEETRPSRVASHVSNTERMVVEPASAGLSQLNYACLLAPRFHSHYLTGDLADRLSEWMPKICIAFGWRLEYLAVRPEYLQWVVNVTPSTSPGYLMRVMRQQTSEKIFSEFPRLKRENPSGDFWAPGYLIMGGLQPHPSQLVKEYLKQTRDRQGISRPR